MKNIYFQGLQCKKCNNSFEPEEDLLLCPKCRNLLDPQYDYGQLKRDWSGLKIESRPNDIWRYRELMPVVYFDRIVTLGEGGAPLLDCTELADEIGVGKFYILNDAGQPTGSLKDRSIAVTATKAREFGYQTLSCDSTGNKAASTAGYAARAGMKSVVVCPHTTPTPKVAQALFYGAHLIKLKAHYSEMNRIYRDMVASRRYHWYDCGTDNPFRYEGKKTYAYEIAQGLGWKCPTYVLQPAAGGMSIVKAWKGFKELREIGLLDDAFPKMVACQAEACGPIVAAINARLDRVPGVEKGVTVASAIAVSNPELLGNETLRAVVESSGSGVHVSDEDLLKTWQRLAKVGIFCEPSSAVAVASAYNIAKHGGFKKEDIVVAVVTGSGFKDSETLDKYIDIPTDVVEGGEALYRVLDKLCEDYGL